MTCRHCGKEFSDEFAYCPFCAEPVRLADRLTEEQRKNQDVVRERVNYGCSTIIYTILAFPGSIMFYYMMFLMKCIFSVFNPDEDFPTALSFETVCLIALCVSAFVCVGMLLYHKYRSEKETLIAVQYARDQTSICPKCGSHNIKIYRKGYNYHQGFWGAIFGVKGAGYAAGFDANTACCRCNNCGNDWETDYDYRLINK